MYRRAAIVRPLRSKRAMISPVKPRANASGFTRIRVRDIGVSGLLRSWLDVGAARLARLDPGLRLAVRAQAPGRIDRLAAVVAAVLELAHAARAAQPVALDLVLAVRAQL